MIVITRRHGILIGNTVTFLYDNTVMTKADYASLNYCDHIDAFVQTRITKQKNK